MTLKLEIATADPAFTVAAPKPHRSRAKVQPEAAQREHDYLPEAKRFARHLIKYQAIPQGVQVWQIENALKFVRGPVPLDLRIDLKLGTNAEWSDVLNKLDRLYLNPKNYPDLESLRQNPPVIDCRPDHVIAKAPTRNATPAPARRTGPVFGGATK